MVWSGCFVGFELFSSTVGLIIPINNHYAAKIALFSSTVGLIIPINNHYAAKIALNLEE
jgi:hypothetical protein